MDSPRQRVIVLCGLPGCGKSSWAAAAYATAGTTTILSRDTLGPGARITDLVHSSYAALAAGHSVCLDNTHVTAEARRPWIELARRHGVPVVAVWFDVAFEQCQIQVLRRMWRAYHALFMDGHVRPRAEADFVGPTRPRRNPTPADAAGVFPVAAMYKARKAWQSPTTAEGFAAVERVDTPAPAWPPATYRHRAVFLDIDGTLRKTRSGEKYPRDPDDIELAHPDVPARLKTLQAAGWLLYGVSNQSGIASGTVTTATVTAGMERVKELVGIDFPIYWCPHTAAPTTCYCRKPQSGWAVGICEAFHVSPGRSVMIGDMTTDRTWAERMGIRFVHARDWHAGREL